MTNSDLAPQGVTVGPVRQRGLLRLRGTKRLDLLHRISTQDLRKLAPGGVAHVAFLDVKGHVVAEGLVAAGADEAWLDLEPQLAAPLRAHLARYVLRDDVQIEDASAASAELVALGPGRADALARALGGRTPPPFAFEHPRLGAPATALLLPLADAEAVRAALLAAGAAALDERALEALRVVAGIPRFGQDLDEHRLPMEAGLVDTAVSFDKGCYLGQEIVVRGTFRGGVQRALARLALPAGAAPGLALRAGGAEVGTVTSAADGPEGRAGLGYVKRAHWAPGTQLETDLGEAVVRGVLLTER